MKKFHFIFDNTEKTQKFKKLFLTKYKNYPPSLSNLFIVIGGDGFMLYALKKYNKFNKPFYGINSGTYGFLMNKFYSFNIHKVVSAAKPITISPLEMKAKTKRNKIFSSIAINEVSLLRQTRQTASLCVGIDKKILIKKLICDGILVATPAGSTAYNSSVNGPILSLYSKKIAVRNFSCPQLSRSRSLGKPPILKTDMYVRLDRRSNPTTTLSEETFSICLGEDVVEFIEIGDFSFG